MTRVEDIPITQEFPPSPCSTNRVVSLVEVGLGWLGVGLGRAGLVAVGLDWLWVGLGWVGLVVARLAAVQSSSATSLAGSSSYT